MKSVAELDCWKRRSCNGSGVTPTPLPPIAALPGIGRPTSGREQSSACRLLIARPVPDRLVERVGGDPATTRGRGKRLTAPRSSSTRGDPRTACPRPPGAAVDGPAQEGG